VRAVVLVGGFGTRLRPLTATTPKQMLTIAHRPMIEWVVAALAAHGISDAVLALGYRPDVFRDAYPDGRCAGVDLHYAAEPEPMNTAGAISFAARHAGIDERFVVVNGDVLTDLDITALVAFHERSGAEGTIALHAVDDPSPYGVVATDPEGRVLAFVEKPLPGEAPSNLINAGTYVFEPSVIERIPIGEPASVERETFPAMVDEGTLFALDDGGAYWLDTGTPQQYLSVQLDVLDGCLGPPPPAIAASARVAPSATVCHAVIGAGAVVDAGALVRDSAVLEDAHVGENARVVDSIVGPRVVVGKGAEVVDGSVLGDGVVLEPGERVAGRRIPEPV